MRPISLSLGFEEAQARPKVLKFPIRGTPSSKVMTPSASNER